MTAYDLVRYRKGTGSFGHVATVLSELAERMDSKRLLAIAKKGAELPVIQRLGDFPGANCVRRSDWSQEHLIL